MWKRFNKSNDRPGSPSRTETAIEAHGAEGSMNLNDGSLSLSARPAWSRKESGDVIKDLPEIPL